MRRNVRFSEPGRDGPSMKLLVGTLYTIENEYEACLTSIQDQTYEDFDHIVIRDLPKQEAHEALYGGFMERANEYDLLVKVDADMILEDRDLFRKIVERFEADPELDLLLIGVHDFFTDRMLIGLNIFRNTVRWSLGNEALFTDMTYIDGTIRKTVKDLTELAPAALHCGDPGAFQAYHYGFHRAMKAVQGGKRWHHIASLYSHYRRNPDIRVAYAMLGANAAFSGRFEVRHISYSDPTLHDYFEAQCGGKTPEEVHRLVKRSKVFRLYRLPIDRRVVYWYYRFRARMRGADQDAA